MSVRHNQDWMEQREQTMLPRDKTNQGKGGWLDTRTEKGDTRTENLRIIGRRNWKGVNWSNWDNPITLSRRDFSSKIWWSKSIRGQFNMTLIGHLHCNPKCLISYDWEIFDESQALSNEMQINCEPNSISISSHSLCANIKQQSTQFGMSWKKSPFGIYWFLAAGAGVPPFWLYLTFIDI